LCPVCSFCGERPVVAWFEGPSFRSSVEAADNVTATETWLACAECLRLVERDDREALVERAVDRLTRQHPDRSNDRARFAQIQRRHLDEVFWRPRGT
jgi:hypothetical protein